MNSSTDSGIKTILIVIAVLLAIIAALIGYMAFDVYQRFHT